MHATRPLDPPNDRVEGRAQYLLAQHGVIHLELAGHHREAHLLRVQAGAAAAVRVRLESGGWRVEGGG